MAVNHKDPNPIQTGNNDKLNDVGDNSADDSDSVRNAENHPDVSWITDVTGGADGGRGDNTSSTRGNRGGRGENTSSTSGNRGGAGSQTNPPALNIKSFFKKKGPLISITAILTILVGGGSLFIGAVAPVAFVASVATDLMDQLSALDARHMKMWRNKVPWGDKNKVITGCRKLSIRCKFKTMSKTQVKRFEKAGFKIVGTKAGPLGNRIRPDWIELNGHGMDPKTFVTELEVKGNNEMRVLFKRAINMKYLGVSDSTFVKFVLGKFGITRAPPELRGNKIDRARALMNKAGVTNIEDVKFLDAGTDEDGRPQYTLEGDKSGRVYSQAEVDKMNANTKKYLKAINKPKSRIGSAALKGLSILGYYDLACSIKNMIGLAAVAAKVSNSAQLAQYAMPFLSMAGKLKASDIDEVDAEVIGEALTGIDERKTLPNVNGEGTIPNPDYGKNAMDSNLYKISLTGNTKDINSNSEVNTPYSLGMGANRLLSGVSSAAEIIDVILGMGTKSDLPCNIVQNWGVRALGLGATIVLGILSGGGITVGQMALMAGMIGGFITVSFILNAALSGSVIGDDMIDAPLERGAAIWTGTSVILGESAKNRGMMPGNSEQIMAYNQLQNESKLDYIAIESQDANPFDASNQYSFLGSFLQSISSHFGSTPSSTSLLGGIPSLVSSSLLSAINPHTTFAKDFDPARFKTCDDQAYNDIGIDADVQCNVRYVMTAADLALDTDDVAQYMEDNGYVEPDTETGLPPGYTPPTGNETQNFAMDQIKGLANTYYNTRSYGDDSIAPRASEYGKFLDYCVYRAMPFGETYEETTAYGSAEPDWVNGKNCMKLGEPYNYFRVYTLDVSTLSTIDEEDPGVTTSPTETTGPASGVGNTDIDYSDKGVNIPCAAGTTDSSPAIQDGYYEDNNGAITLEYGGSPYRVTKVKVRICDVGSERPVNSQISASALQMLKDSSGDNIKLNIYSGFRDMTLQKQLWADDPNPLNVAKPGTSNHQMGIAMDLACGTTGRINDHSNPCFIWLDKNAAKYGFKNYIREPWHWSVGGN